jgi:hypothetical protein
MRELKRRDSPFIPVTEEYHGQQEDPVCQWNTDIEELNRRVKQSSMHERHISSH